MEIDTRLLRVNDERVLSQTGCPVEDVYRVLVCPTVAVLVLPLEVLTLAFGLVELPCVCGDLDAVRSELPPRRDDLPVDLDIRALSPKVKCGLIHRDFAADDCDFDFFCHGRLLNLHAST